MRTFVARALIALITLTVVPSFAHATVTEPNGLVVPRDSMNGEIQLYTFFTSRGEPINWLTDGAAMPAVFSPLCGFRATFVLHQAGSNFSMGWYNADTTTPPTLAQIHVVVPAGSPVGTVITGANIRSDPNYHGGYVGFALLASDTHYSELRWNTVCTSCTPPAPWYLAVIYRSATTPNAFYVAFEDGATSATGFGNDGDFNDDVYFFEGLQCMGGGLPCDTGLIGACAQGLTQCSSTGTTCHQTVMPTAERCNGVDDDCNGMIDDGMNLCAPGLVCDRGACVPRCVEGGCFTGQVCSTRGTCVETACATVTCPSGQVCTGGLCHGVCDSVMCPAAQVCRGGACVDPCVGVTCAAGQVCEGGVCVVGCGCNVCDTGRTCDTASNHCVDNGCVGLMCAAGQVCTAGACADGCTGVVCPSGQMCMTGQCVAASDAGVGDAGSTSDGSVASDGGSMVDAAFDGARGDALGVDGARIDGGALGSSSAGCACRVPSAPRHVRPVAWLWALGGALVFARRKRT